MADLDLLLADGVIDEVVGGLKSGKEADVWLVRHNGELLAAKLYKERHARNFKNNAGYKEGRAVRNSRTQRAMDKGSRFGQAAAEEAWKSAEADALYKLHAAGVRVPTPVMFYEGVLLMQLVTDAEGQPAPRLIEAQLSRETARAFYEDLRSQVVKMLCADLIHGDLSPYNVLLGAAGPTIIDFPQIITAAANSQSEFFLRRDLENLHTYFRASDAALPGIGDAREIWRAYTRRELAPDFVPTGVAPREDRRPHGRPQRVFSPGTRPPGAGPSRAAGEPRPAGRGPGAPRHEPRPPGQRNEVRPGLPSEPRGSRSAAGSRAPAHDPRGGPGRIDGQGHSPPRSPGRTAPPGRGRGPEVSYRGQLPLTPPAAAAPPPKEEGSPPPARRRRRRRR